MKSHESLLLDLVCCVITDAHTVCATRQSAMRDIETLQSRVKHEGLSFLTITLPQYGSDFERSLDQGHIVPTCFRMFKKHGVIPVFLKGILAQVFDADTGGILDDPSVEAIRAIRQVAYTLKKLKLACSPNRVSRAFSGYISDEHDLEIAISQEDDDYYKSVARCCWYWLSDARITQSVDAIPRHGPGSTADKITGNRKYVWQRWHERLEPYFPMLNYAFSSESVVLNGYYDDDKSPLDQLEDTEALEFKCVTLVSESDEMPVKVITVPKTLKTPRIIAMEPVCMQYAQQALSQVLCKELEEARFTKGHINFTDQTVNRNLAITSSRSGKYATLDLSSASDRVPRDLVKDMFHFAPDFHGAIEACRSRRAKLPTGEVITLKKFASMGSALCFPIESMYFYTLCVAGLLKKRSLPVTPRNCFEVSRDVYIYGDDIIVPKDEVATVIDYLQKYYCKVGAAKSFWTGKFRESCGMDAYDGRCVTPVYVRMAPPDDRRATSALISWVETSNQFLQNWYESTASFLMGRCQKILGKLPRVRETCAGLGIVAVNGAYDVEKTDKAYQSPRVRTWVPVSVQKDDELTGYHALTKCLLKLHSQKSTSSVGDTKHLERTADRKSVV